MSKKYPVVLQSDILESQKELMHQNLSHNRSLSKHTNGRTGGGSANVSVISYSGFDELGGGKGQNRSMMNAHSGPREELGALLAPMFPPGENQRYYSPKGIPNVFFGNQSANVNYSPGATILDMVLSSKKTFESQDRSPQSQYKPEVLNHHPPLSSLQKTNFENEILARIANLVNYEVLENVVKNVEARFANIQLKLETDEIERKKISAELAELRAWRETSCEVCDRRGKELSGKHKTIESQLKNLGDSIAKSQAEIEIRVDDVSKRLASSVERLVKSQKEINQKVDFSIDFGKNLEKNTRTMVETKEALNKQSTDSETWNFLDNKIGLITEEARENFKHQSGLITDLGKMYQQNNLEIVELKNGVTRLEEDFLKILKLTNENADQIMVLKPFTEELAQLKMKQIQIIEILNTMNTKRRKEK